MPHIEKSIVVDVPVQTAYNQWTQFEEFPKFMNGVREVHQIDDTRMVWHAEIGGQKRSWEAEITEQIPDKRIAWRNRTSAKNAGVVTFHYVSDTETRVMLQMDYETEGVLESVGDAVGFMSREVEGDLERFKEYVESRGVETGGWRGEVRHHTDTTHPGS
jgi:uncharacterized membrane protein